jgi:hypothetical protein
LGNQHDRGPAEGWPPVLGRAARPGAELFQALALAPGAGPARGMAADRGVQPTPAEPHPQVMLTLPEEAVGLGAGL